jgi:hypothetical protein
MGAPSTGRRWLRRLGQTAAALILIYAGLAYALLPTFWRHYDGHERLANLDYITQTSLGLPGDPINVALEGTERDVICAMTTAGWTPADPITLRSSLGIAGSVVFDRPYDAAPVSPLFYDGRRQDLAFEKLVGTSADRRHHVRFWKALAAKDGAPPTWLGSVTFDRGVGLSAYTGQITHHIGPDVDAERDGLVADLSKAGVVVSVGDVSGVAPALVARNGGGDPYFTDGELAVVALSPDCKPRSGAPAVEPVSAPVAAKDWLFGLIGALRRRL